MNHRMQASRSTPRPVSNIRPSYVQRGHILWLPRKGEISDQSLLNGVTLGDDAYNHLVVVLHTEPLAKIVTLYLLTSRRPDVQVQQYRLPIFPTPPHLENGLQLRLDDGRYLDKQSYVRIEKAYSIPWTIIRPCRGDKIYKFTQESFAILIRCYGPPTSGPLSYSSLGDIEDVSQTTMPQAAQPGRARALQGSNPSQYRFPPISHSQRGGPLPAQTYPLHHFSGQRPTGPVRPPVHRRDQYEDYIQARLAQYEEEEPNIPWRLVFALAGLGIAFLYYPILVKRTRDFLVWGQERGRWIRGCLTFVRENLKVIFTPVKKAIHFLEVLCSRSTRHGVLAYVQGSLRPKCQSLVLGLRGVLDKLPSPDSFPGPLAEVPDNALMKDLASRGEGIVRGYVGRIGGLLQEKKGEFIGVWRGDGC